MLHWQLLLSSPSDQNIIGKELFVSFVCSFTLQREAPSIGQLRTTQTVCETLSTLIVHHGERFTYRDVTAWLPKYAIRQNTSRRYCRGCE